MSTNLRAFFLMMVVQFISYLNLTFNFRAIAHGQYWVILVTDGAAVAISIFIVKRVSGAKTEFGWQEAGMVIGGSVAGVLGTWLTRGWG